MALAWARERGAFLHPALTVREDGPNGRGLFAKAAVESGDWLRQRPVVVSQKEPPSVSMGTMQAHKVATARVIEKEFA